MRCGPDAEPVLFKDLPARAAAALAAYEVESPGVLATRLPATPAHALLLLGALDAGWIAAPLSTRLPLETALQTARRAGARMLADTRPIPVPAISASDPEPPDLCTLLFTSGSTGAPKGIGHPFAAHVASARGSSALLPLGPGDSWLLDLPLYHVSGLSILFRCILSGACAVFPEHPGRIPAGITHLSMVATQLHRLLSAKTLPPSSLRVVLAGGGPFADSLLLRALQRGWPLHLTYGMTETASQCCTSTRLDTAVQSFSCGHPLPGREIQTAPDEEILVRGDVLFTHQLTDEFFHPRTPGWFATGDLGRIDPVSGLRILGRKDRMFISGGENIHPETIERALLEIPDVLSAVVVPVPDPEFGQRPAALIETSSAGEWNTFKIRLADALRERLPSTHLPARYLPMPQEFAGGKPPLPACEEYARGAEERL